MNSLQEIRTPEARTLALAQGRALKSPGKGGRTSKLSLGMLQDVKRAIDATPPIDPKRAPARARDLTGCFPARPADFDARPYVREVIRAFSEYPEETIEAAALDLVRTCKFLPSVAEIVEALERKQGELFRTPAALAEAHARRAVAKSMDYGAMPYHPAVSAELARRCPAFAPQEAETSPLSAKVG